jgi:hypothetical protein
VRWKELGRNARALRLAHAVIAVAELTGLAYVWACALQRRRDRWLTTAVGILCVQGIGVVIGRGNCPLGPLQRRLGDPTPLFDLVLSPRAAKAAFPVLLVATLTAMVAVLMRPPITADRPSFRGLTTLARRAGRREHRPWRCPK